MTDLSTIGARPVTKILVYGPPKVGKTELVGKLAQHHKLIWIDLEKGYETLLKMPDEWKKNIDLIRIHDSPDDPNAINTLLKVLNGKKHTLCEEHGKIACIACKTANAPTFDIELNALPKGTIVVIDSLTQLVSSAMAHIGKGQPLDYKFQHDDWGNLGKLMDIALKQIQATDHYSVVAISHEMEVEFEDGKTKIVPVSGTRNYSRNSAKFFDHVLYVEVKNKKHTAGSATNYAMNIVTGSRKDIAIENMAELSLLPFFNGEIKQAESKVDSQGEKSASNMAEKLKQIREGQVTK